MLSPLPRRSHWRYCVAHPSSGVSLPRYGSRVGPRIGLFEACSAFTRVTACTLALSPYFVTRFTRRLQPLRYLHDCSGCFRLELSPGGIRTHWKAPPYHGARPKAAICSANAIDRVTRAQFGRVPERLLWRRASRSCETPAQTPLR